MATKIGPKTVTQRDRSKNLVFCIDAANSRSYGGEPADNLFADPNNFGGVIKISKKDSNWEVIDTKNMYLGIPNKENGETMIANYRGIGLSDMVNCINNKKKARCSIDLALHVLEIMDGILTSSEDLLVYKMITSCEQPEYLSEKEIKDLRVN